MLTRRITSASERAFTMIELIVSMVLLAVVLSMVVYAVVELGHGNSDAMTNRKAQREALDAMETMRGDVTAARSPALEQWDGRREPLRDILYFGEDSMARAGSSPSRDMCGGVSYVTCMRDITVAGPRAIWMRVGDRCVGYQVDGTALNRYSSNDWRGCGSPSGGMKVERLMEATGLASTSTAPFSYTTRHHPSVSRVGHTDPNGCLTARSPGPTGNQLNWITSVNVDLSGVTSERAEDAGAALRTSLPVTSRVAGDFAYAMGCSY